MHSTLDGCIPVLLILVATLKYAVLHMYTGYGILAKCCSRQLYIIKTSDVRAVLNSTWISAEPVQLKVSLVVLLQLQCSSMAFLSLHS